jgi:hypothetical protein
MKKLIFILTLVIATTIIYGLGKSANLDNPNDTKSVSKNNLRELNSDQGSAKLKETARAPQKVKFLLYSNTVKADWSPSVWWNPQGANAGKDGC